MAKFIVNSTAKKAVRKDEVSNLEITYTATNQPIEGEPTGEFYSLNIFFTRGRGHVEFETDTTLEGIQAKAVTILEALEAE